jgi:hypothetical protein
MLFFVFAAYLLTSDVGLGHLLRGWVVYLFLQEIFKEGIIIVYFEVLGNSALIIIKK